MNDMPRPRPVPSPSPDHQQHDVLLVAQYAAGDPLDDDRQRAAAALVSSCGDCAELAADLRAITTAVAWEPVPPRRRDFRIDAPTAERLRGSRLTRFLRRLSLPQARALAPAAVGVMSIGLLFVVAGTVWPAADLGLSGAPVVVAPAAEAPDEGAPLAAEPLAPGSLAPGPLVDSLAPTLDRPADDTSSSEADAAAGSDTYADTDGLADEAPALEMQAAEMAGKAAEAEDAGAGDGVKAAARAAGVEPAGEAGAPEGTEPEAFALDAIEEAVGQGTENEAAGALEPAAALEATAEEVPAVAEEVACCRRRGRR